MLLCIDPKSNREDRGYLSLLGISGPGRISIPPQYSYAPAPAEAPRITIDSGTDFARAVNGKDLNAVWRVLDELMSTVAVLHPRLYRATMRELEGI